MVTRTFGSPKGVLFCPKSQIVNFTRFRDMH